MSMFLQFKVPETNASYDFFVSNASFENQKPESGSSSDDVIYESIIRNIFDQKLDEKLFYFTNFIFFDEIRKMAETKIIFNPGWFSNW